MKSTTDRGVAAAEDSPEGWVDRLVDAASRDEAVRRIVAYGGQALPALRAGLRDGRWPIRRWCATLLAGTSDRTAYDDVVRLARDPKAEVRMAALQSAATISGLAGLERLRSEDLLPRLLERLELDPSIRVRRLAILLLAPDVVRPLVREALRAVAQSSEDPKARRMARWAVGQDPGASGRSEGAP